jgi:hypothetical protein
MYLRPYYTAKGKNMKMRFRDSVSRRELLVALVCLLLGVAAFVGFRVLTIRY